MSRIGSFFGQSYEAADPNEPPISAKDVRLPDITDTATGEQKLLLLAFENGFIDPYCNLPVERKENEGTKENPIKVESFTGERMIGCVCEPTQNHVKYTHLYMGHPKRCNCGHWLELVPAPRFWEKIPKEDLLEITWFRELEEEGKLDKFLETGEVPEKGHGAHAH